MSQRWHIPWRVLCTLGALLLSFGAGWYLKPSTQCVDQPVRTLSPTDDARRVLQQLVTRLQAKDAQTTAQSLRLLKDNLSYRDTIRLLRVQQGRDSAAWANATTPHGSAAACSLVVLDCSRRAALAERRADELQTQLGKQTQLQSRRFGLMVMGPHARIGGGSLIGWETAIAVGFGWRVF